MKKQKGHLIKSVDPGSIAEELELEPGDRLLTINGNEVEDIFDYEYYVDSESMVMLVEKADGEQWELEIENEYQDLGITFENGLMSDYKSCSNKCIFCFIDQMPKGMRETLYFKDDDTTCYTKSVCRDPKELEQELTCKSKDHNRDESH